MTVATAGRIRMRSSIGDDVHRPSVTFEVLAAGNADRIEASIRVDAADFADFKDLLLQVKSLRQDDAI